MVGKRLVGGGDPRVTTVASAQNGPCSVHLSGANSCKARFEQPKAFKPLSSNVHTMASNGGSHGTVVKELDNPDKDSGDYSPPGIELQLNEKLERLSMEPPNGAVEQKVDGKMNGGQDSNGCQDSNSPCGTFDAGRARNDSQGSPGRDSRVSGQQNMEQRSHHQPARRRYSDRAREYRPPTLTMPVPLAEVEPCRFQQPPFDDQATRNGFCLPSSLVSSPRSNEIRNLDPNAREFTPYMATAASPGVQHLQVMHFGHPFPMTPEMPHVAYNPDMNGTNYPVPSYPNGGPVNYGAVSTAPTSWDRQPIGVVIPAGVGNVPGCRSHAPPLLVGQQSTQHIGMQHVNLPHPPPPSGPFYVPPSGIDSHSVFFQSLGTPPPTWKEHISRTLLLTGVAGCVGETQLLNELEQWGPVRALELERQQEGLVTVHYFDLRHAREALKDIQNQHLLKQQQIQQQFQSHRSSQNGFSQNGSDRCMGDLQQKGIKSNEEKVCEAQWQSEKRGLIGGNVVWAQYATSTTSVVQDAHNQGTLVVFNVDADVSLDDLRAAFQKYGDVKELRETPSKRQHKFVEFYDVRDAATAWSALNGQEICGKSVKIEFSRPGGQARRARAQAQAHMPTICLPSGAGSVLVNGRINTPMASPLQQPLHLGWNGETCVGPQPLAGTLSGAPTTYIWPPNYGLGSGHPFTYRALDVQQQWHRIPEGQPQPMAYPASYGGAPCPNGMVLPANTGTLLGRANGAVADFTPRAGSPRGTGFPSTGRAGCSGTRNGEVSALRRRRNGVCNGNGTNLKMDLSQMLGVDRDSRFAVETGVVQRELSLSGRTGLTPRSSPRESPAQYMFDEREVHLNLESPRTTLMIRNIPNKYSQQMLLSLLDQHCLRCNKSVDSNDPQSAYDFVYLPIDFKNRCNLGYAFVNFTTALATLKFYRAFHDQAWEAFNSKKICEIAYARVQGRAALEEHFRNSRFACDTDDYLPLVFVPPRTGIECPPPIVAAGHLAGRTLSARVDSCKSPTRIGFLHDQGGDRSLQDEKGSFEGTGLVMVARANVTVEGVGA